MNMPKSSDYANLADYTAAMKQYVSSVVLNKSSKATVSTPTQKQTTYVPSASAAKTVSKDTVTSPTSIYGEYEPYFQLVADQSAANTARQIEFANAQNAFQKEQNKIAMDFNAAEAAKNRDWQQYMSNTAHQREVADLQAAGLNPVLSATGGNGAAVTSGATASGVSSSGTKAELDQSTTVAMLNLLNNVMGYATQTATAGINAGATVAASKYSADTQYQIKQDFPQTGAALAASIGNDVAQSLGYTSWNAALADLAKGLTGGSKENLGSKIRNAYDRVSDWISSHQIGKKK